MTSKPTRRAAGRKAQSNGQTFEDRLNWQHQQYRARGAAVRHNGPPSRPVRAIVAGRPMVVGLPLGPGWLDYSVVCDGWIYEFDAKSVESGPWPFDSLEEHQARSLDEATTAGRGRVIAGIVLSMEGGRRVFWCPWTRLAPKWWAWKRRIGVAPRGTASLSAEDCAAIGRECSGVDWMAVAGAMHISP